MPRRFTAAAVAVAALAVPAPALAADTTVSPQDMTYLCSAIAGDRFEVGGGKMAATKTSTPAVKTLANQAGVRSQQVAQAGGDGRATPRDQGPDRADPARAVGDRHLQQPVRAGV